MSKGEVCFQQFSGPASSTEVPPPPDVADDVVDIEMTPQLIECLKAAIGEERFAAIWSGQSQPTPEEMSKGAVCFQGNTGSPPPGSAPPPPACCPPPGDTPPDVGPPEMDPWLEGCLREAVGNERFDAISSGQSEPTEVEMQKGMACFDRLGHEQPTVVSSPGHELDTGTVQCLKLALGEERFHAISRGEISPTLADREKGDKCFGSTPAPMSPPPEVVLDDSVMACLRDAVGVERFEAIKSGESVPTAEEQAKGEVCFSTAGLTDGPTADIVLPPPADEVPYLPEDTEAVSVDEVTQEQTPEPQATPSDQTEAIIIEGTAPPGEVVDIYIHSETTVVAATEADASGRWSYTLVQPLEEGDHLAYATTRVDGETVRSSAKTFQVAGEMSQPAASSTTSDGASWTMWAVVAGAALFVSVAIGAAYTMGRNRNRPNR
jgi:hypothetical protein